MQAADFKGGWMQGAVRAGRALAAAGLTQTSWPRSDPLDSCMRTIASLPFFLRPARGLQPMCNPIVQTMSYAWCRARR